MKKTQSSILEKIIGAMLMVVVGFMPLIVQIVERPFPPELAYLMGRETYLDMFAYWKGILVLVPAVVIVFVVVSDWLTSGKLPKFKELVQEPPVFISLAYLAAILVSTLVSPYVWTSWFGTYARSEGMFMWLAYFVVFFAAIYFSRRLENTRFILYGLAFSSVIMGAIGVSQLVERDFFNTNLASWLVTAGRSSVSPAFEIAHGTLFNPNTFGKYTAMVAPLLLLTALTYNGKRFVNLFFLAGGVLMLVSVFASASLGGLVGISTAVIVLIVTFLCRPGIPWKRLAIAGGPVVAVLVLAVLFFPPLNERVTFLFNRLGVAMRAEPVDSRSYLFDENTMAVLDANGETLVSIEVQGMGANWLLVRDRTGTAIAPTTRVVPPAERPIDGVLNVQATVYTFDIPGYRRLTIDKFPDMFFYNHQTTVPFYLTYHDGRIYGISPAGIPIDLHETNPAWGFAGRESWGSNRGYIWSRSFPLMFTMRGLTVGYGPDTFINTFPTYDIAARQQLFGSPYMIVDKAHNIVLQTWISTGMVSAIALLALFGHYFFSTFITLIKEKRGNTSEKKSSGEVTFSYGLRLGLLCAVSAYVMSSMATDTTIGSTGVFFVLLGMVYGANYFENGFKKSETKI